MEDILKFNSQKAKENLQSKNSDELKLILTEIKNFTVNAQLEKRTIHIYRELSRYTLDELFKRGFGIFEQSDIAIQKDSLYYTISW